MRLKATDTVLLRCVEFFYHRPHRHDGDTPIRIRSRDLRQLKFPTDAFAFQFYDMVEVTVELGHRRFILSERLNESKTYYYGEAMKITTALRRFPEERSQIMVQRNTGTKRILRSIFGHWYPLEKSDIVINPRHRRKR